MHIITVTQAGYHCDCGAARSSTSEVDAVFMAHAHAKENTPAFVNRVKFFPTDNPM
jgi:hypothetical protein